MLITEGCFPLSVFKFLFIPLSSHVAFVKLISVESIAEYEMERKEKKVLTKHRVKDYRQVLATHPADLCIQLPWLSVIVTIETQQSGTLQLLIFRA